MVALFNVDGSTSTSKIQNSTMDKAGGVHLCVDANYHDYKLEIKVQLVVLFTGRLRGVE